MKGVALTVVTVFPPIPIIPLALFEEIPLLLLMIADVAVPKLPPVAEFPEIPPCVAAPPEESEGFIRAPPVTPPTDALFAYSPPI